MVIEPNYSIVLTFFGKYVGTVKQNGLQFVNPLYTKLKVSLRSQSIESTKLKVNDKLGNPIEIAAVILYEINDTYKAVFDVSNFNEYIRNQSEAAVRHLATSYPYDNIEDENDRRAAIMVELKRLSYKTVDELQTIRLEMEEVCRYNQNHFYKLYNEKYGTQNINGDISKLIEKIWGELK